MKLLMTERQREVLEKQSVETLCEWYCLLNMYKWPAGLPDDPYRGLPDDERRRIDGSNEEPLGNHGVMILWIEERVGEKEISRYWQTVHMTPPHRKSNDEFERWWDENGRGE